MRAIPPSAGTAKTLILIALILQILGSLALVAIALLLAGLLAATGFGALSALIFVLAVVVIIVAILAYLYSYSPVSEGRYHDARTPTLILGIVGLFAGGLIVGILYLVAWDKLGDAIREQQMPMMPQMGYVPVAVPFPAAAPAGPPPPPPPLASAPACPRCHNPGTWVVQYNRYYCYHCQQYI